MKENGVERKLYSTGNELTAPVEHPQPITSSSS